MTYFETIISENELLSLVRVENKWVHLELKFQNNLDVWDNDDWLYQELHPMLKEKKSNFSSFLSEVLIDDNTINRALIELLVRNKKELKKMFKKSIKLGWYTKNDN